MTTHPSYLDASLLADAFAGFEDLWHSAGDPDPDDFSNVRLGCTGELAQIGSVILVGVRAFPGGGELVEFDCPRCEQRHESRLLR